MGDAPPRRAWEEGPLGPSLLSWPPSILQVHCGVTAAVSSAGTLSSLSGSDDILGSCLFPIREIEILMSNKSVKCHSHSYRNKNWP